MSIEIGGKPLDCPSKKQLTDEYQKAMAKNVGARNEIEAMFGTCKKVYKANDIKAKLSHTGKSWTTGCYFAKNLMKFLRGLLCTLFNMLDFMQNRLMNQLIFELQGQRFGKYVIPPNCIKL